MVADENGGKLDNHVVFYWDEVGTIPRIESEEMMFSSSHSKRVSIVPMIQSFAQLNTNYGKKGAEFIIDNCQELICKGWFLPPNTYDCGSFVVNRKAVVGKELKPHITANILP